MVSQIEEKKEVVRRHLEAMNGHDREDCVECFADDASPHGLDLDEFIEAEFAWFDAFPDLRYSIHDVFGEGDRVTIHWTFEGTHTQKGGPGALSTLEPTHEEVEIEGINIAHLEDGKIVEYTGTWDVHLLLDTIGLIDLPT